MNRHLWGLLFAAGLENFLTDRLLWSLRLINRHVEQLTLERHFRLDLQYARLHRTEIRMDRFRLSMEAQEVRNYSLLCVALCYLLFWRASCESLSIVNFPIHYVIYGFGVPRHHMTRLATLSRFHHMHIMKFISLYKLVNPEEQHLAVDRCFVILPSFENRFRNFLWAEIQERYSRLMSSQS